MKSIIAILLTLLLAATSFAEKNTKITEDKTTLQKQEMREIIKNADREKRIQKAISKKNIINIDLKEYPDIIECLIRNTSIEPRAVNFFVKNNKRGGFERLFNKYFSNDFDLHSKEEIIKSK